jgi:hypothetical protein
MGDLKKLAAELQRWQESCQELGDDYDEAGNRDGAYFQWGKARGYKEAAEVLLHAIEQEARDA